MRPDMGKIVSVNLNPLRRFLEKNIGQPWNKVYSEICLVADKRNREGHDFLDKLRWLTSGYFPDFFVDSETGLLQKSKRTRYKATRPNITRIEFLSSVEVVFAGQKFNSPNNWVTIKKIRLCSILKLFTPRSTDSWYLASFSFLIKLMPV